MGFGGLKVEKSSTLTESITLRASVPEEKEEPSSKDAEEEQGTDTIKEEEPGDDNAVLNNDEKDKGTATTTSWPRCSVPLEQQNTNSNTVNQKPEVFFQFLTGIKQDLKSRAPYYKSDWGRPRSFITIINAVFFAFVVQLIPALIFAELMDKQTMGNIAAAETLLSAGIIGIIYAIVSGQPFPLLGITGPVAILLGKSYNLAGYFDSEYWPFFWWLCMWTALLHFITAITGMVNFVWWISPFTTQIFELFIATTFIFESLRDLIEPLHLGDTSHSEDRSAAYASFILGMLSFSMCWKLHFAETWSLFSRQIRTFLASYNMAIVVIIVTALR